MQVSILTQPQEQTVPLVLDEVRSGFSHVQVPLRSADFAVASAHQFAQNGAKALYICDYNDSNLATHTRELASLYPDVEVHIKKFDAADESSVKAVVDDAIKTYGRLDIFFANAGVVGQNKLFSDITAEEVLATLRTNVVRYG
jgi:NAD(P)-dependent dehydrogenase (short-subunit alcohol dehydrogenase family)